jgi:hypothetical protein
MGKDESSIDVEGTAIFSMNRRQSLEDKRIQHSCEPWYIEGSGSKKLLLANESNNYLNHGTKVYISTEQSIKAVFDVVFPRLPSIYHR